MIRAIWGEINIAAWRVVDWRWRDQKSVKL